VEVYDPVKDVWEDGIPLTSGRSGLASAVIYQPSCHQNYSQDCLGNLSSNREYDDEKKPPDNQDDDGDLSSRGAGSSYHLDCSSNFFSGQKWSGGQFDRNNIPECDQISGEFYRVMKEIDRRFQLHCAKNESSEEQKFQLQQLFDDDHMVKLARLHVRCKKHSTCPLRSLKKKFRHFIFNSKSIKPSQQLGNSLKKSDI
jgi:hypothetical protein